MNGNNSGQSSTRLINFNEIFKIYFALPVIKFIDIQMLHFIVFIAIC